MEMVRESIEHATPEPKAAWNELTLVLNEQASRLPERLRIPVILGDLESQADDEGLEGSHRPAGTVSTRLTRARVVVSSGLMRRRDALSAAFRLRARSRGTVFTVVVPEELVDRTVRAVVNVIPFCTAAKK
jgi:hypothetical protein